MKRPSSIACLGLFAAALIGCSPDPPQHAPAAVAAQPRVREPRPAAPQDPASDGLIATGPVTVEQQLDIVALRAGVITGLPVDVDARLSRGALMAQLDGRQLDADRNTAAHKLESADADLKNWESELQVKKADLRRADQMHNEGINTQEAYEHARYEETASEYEVERQRADVLSAKSSLESLDLELQKTRIVAPFNGIVSQRFVRLGQYVTIGEKLFRFVGTSPLQVRFTLPAAALRRVTRGQQITVSDTPAFRRTATAVIQQISPVVDPGSNTIEVTAVLTQPLPGLVPGMVASIRIGTR